MDATLRASSSTSTSRWPDAELTRLQQVDDRDRGVADVCAEGVVVVPERAVADRGHILGAAVTAAQLVGLVV
jgi:hypothetical protein